MPPTSDEQIRFLVSLQRLLDEGLFVASYRAEFRSSTVSPAAKLACNSRRQIMEESCAPTAEGLTEMFTTWME